jgi:hypothetical protein
MLDIDQDSVMNPLYLADPKEAALAAVIDSFEGGILGYALASQAATRNGSLEQFSSDINAKAATAEKRIRILAGFFCGGFVEYLRQRGYAANRGDEALASFDADIATRLAQRLAATA